MMCGEKGGYEMKKCGFLDYLIFLWHLWPFCPIMFIKGRLLARSNLFQFVEINSSNQYNKIKRGRVLAGFFSVTEKQTEIKPSASHKLIKTLNSIYQQHE